MLTIFSFNTPVFGEVLLPLLGLSIAALVIGYLISAYFSGIKIAGLNRQINQHIDNYDQLSHEHQSTLAAKAVLEEEKQELAEALSAEKALVADWTSKHEKLSYSYDVLNKKHLDLFTNHTDLERKHSDVLKQYGDLGKKHMALTNQFTEKEVEAQGYKTALDDLEKKYAQKESDLAQKVAELGKATSSISTLNESIAQTAKEWEGKQATWTAEMAALQKAYQALQDK